MDENEKNVRELMNIGPRTAAWLNAIGVETRGELAELGAVAAYCLINAQGYNTSLNLLWALYGALHNQKWNALPSAVKQQLRADADGFRFGSEA